jgi:cbb3-type cytochrome oxidase maturation protein
MTTDDFIIYAVLIGSVAIFGGAAVLALSWAVRDGQFQNFDRGARSIFGPDEPVGERTDQFPDLPRRGEREDRTRGVS